jgi:hypothetical protein
LRQVVEARSQSGPIILRPLVEALAMHELVDGCGAIEHCFHVSGDRLVIVKTVVKPFGLLVEILDKGVDVVFTIRVVKATAIERGVQTAAETVRLIFDSMKNPLYFFIA